MLGVALLSATALLLVVSHASAASFPNAAPITITDATTLDGTAPAKASAYPSNVNVTGLTGTVSKVSVDINGFAHACPIDVDMMLVGPAGQKALLMSDSGDCASDVVSASNQQPTRADVNLTFDDAAAGALAVPCLNSGTLQGGTYLTTDQSPSQPLAGQCHPAGVNGVGSDDTNTHTNIFPSPAPAGVATTGLGTFNGSNPNGTWSLYVVDQYQNDAGHISHGWNLNVTIAPPTVTAPAIAGTAQVGQTLTALSGTIGGGGTPSWQWKRCDGNGVTCTNVGGNSPTYTLTAADQGSAIKVTETVTNSGGSNSADSAPTAPVAAAPNTTPQQPNLPAVVSFAGTKTKQKVLSQGGVLTSFTSTVSGDLVATGTVSVPKLAKVYRFKTVKAKVAANNRTTVALKLPKSALKAIKKALAKHKKLSAKITLTVTTASGAKTTVTKTVRLTK